MWVTGNMRRYGVPFCVSILALACHPRAMAQFNFNFSSTGNVVASVANVSCAGGTGSMGGMGGGAACDGNFLQEVTSINGQQYYHIVVGNGGGEFGIEYFIRTVGGGVCWYGCTGARVAGMGGMAGGGVAPLSSSDGAGGLNGNNTNPLASSNSGVGRPDRAAIRMFNNTSGMTQEFLKSTELLKPRITQTVSDATTTVNFTIDMSAIAYNDMSRAGTLSLRQTVNDPNFPGQQTNPQTGAALQRSDVFDIDQISGSGVDKQITGGRFTYSAGSGDGGSLGTYNYFADSYDVYAVNWTSYCDPAQNPISNCTNYGTGAGGMGGGTTSGGGMGGATTTTTAGTTTTTAAPVTTTTSTATTTTSTSTTTTTLSGGSSGGGMGDATTTTTANTTTTTAGTTTTTTTSTTTSTTTTTTSTSTTTTTLSGGGMGGM